MHELRFSTCQASIHELHCRAVVVYLRERLNLPLMFVDDIRWQERYIQLDSGAIHASWICGLPYLRRVDDKDTPPIELLAAPVMAAPRYADRPLHFSDICVRNDSHFRSFADLRGASWAYNEPSSHSGFNVVRWHLARHGLNWSYFSRVIESGAHQRSVQMILDGEVDASAIDSTVLESVLQADPLIGERLRIIDTLGPSPIPPWVIRTDVPADIRNALRQALITMHDDPRGREILTEGGLARFADVTDRDYDVLREMTRLAAQVDS